MTKRKGKGARKVAQHRARLRSQAQNTDASRGAMQASLYHGSKCEKTPAERRPNRGGHVRGTGRTHRA